MSTKKITQDEFVKRCKIIHGNKFNYSNAIYVNATTKVEVTCNKCNNTWLVIPSNHYGPSKSGCPKCKIKNQIGRDVKSTKQIINEIKKAHGNNFLYDKLVYKNCNTKITVGCKIHGYFEKWPNDLKNGSGCPKCSGNYHKTHNDFVNEIKRLLPHISVIGTYKNALTKIDFYCNTHNKHFTNKPNGLLSSHIGCDQCSYEKMINTKVKSGAITDPKYKSEYEQYQRAVWRSSNKTYRAHLSEQIRDKFNHLDHILSIFEGFKNEIPPIIMGSIHNLRIISAKKNQSKSYKSDQSPVQLVSTYDSKPHIK